MHQIQRLSKVAEPGPSRTASSTVSVTAQAQSLSCHQATRGPRLHWYTNVTVILSPLFLLVLVFDFVHIDGTDYSGSMFTTKRPSIMPAVASSGSIAIMIDDNRTLR